MLIFNFYYQEPWDFTLSFLGTLYILEEDKKKNWLLSLVEISSF